MWQDSPLPHGLSYDLLGQDLFGGFVPGLLNRNDLPEIAASLAPQGANGDAIPESRFRAVFGASPHVRLIAQEWNLAAFRQLLAE